jgi:ubiquinone/menaquinone biosynthesis C-methylase UbiE
MQTDRSRLREYYSSFSEWDRLGSPAGSLEFEKAMQILDRYLSASCHVLDIGGGPGRYAIELARRGHRVVLADPSLALLAQARERIAGSDVQDRIESIDEASAEDLGRYPATTFDAVVAFGPFYHLLSEPERSRAAKELWRVLRSDGLAFVAIVPRLSAITGLIERAARFPDQVTPESIRRVAETGVFRNAARVGFQEGYYPASGEVEQLLGQAGFEVLTTISLRSIAYRIEAELRSITGTMRVEAERLLASLSTMPEIVATSGHALIIAKRRPS